MNVTLPETTENFVALKVSGKLRKEDYLEFIPELERRIAKYGKISFYFEMEDFDGWTPLSLWEDAKFDLRHGRDFERIAIVGGTSLHKAVSVVVKPFTSAKVRYFDETDRESALDWAQYGIC